MAATQAQFIADGNRGMQTKVASHRLHVGRNSYAAAA
jgi:hypothetical protein